MPAWKALSTEDLKLGRAVVLVDEIGRFSQGLVRRSVAAGRLIVFRAVVPAVQKTAWFQAAAKDGHLCEFNEAAFHSLDEYWRADDQAFEVVEQVYAALRRLGLVPVETLSSLYDVDAIDSACKKNLLMRLAEFFQSLAIVRMLTKEGLEVAFYPSSVWAEARRWLVLADVHWEWPEHAQIRRNAWTWSLSFDWLKWAGILAFLPFWVVGGVRRVAWSLLPPRSTQVGVRVYTTDWGFRGEGSREIDWLLDGHRVNRENTLFVIEKPIAAQYRDEFSKRNYRMHDLSGREAFRSVSLKFFRELLNHGLRVWAGLLLAAPSTPSVFLEVAARGWLEYIRWTAFLEHWRPRHYVVYNHFHFDHIFRNARLRSVGCNVWFYTHSVNDRCVFYDSPPQRQVKSKIGRAYLEYDYEIHWGRRDADMYRLMHGKSRHCLVWGPLWSAFVKPLPKLTNLLEERKAKEGLNVTLAVFDSNFNVGSPYSAADARDFFEAFVELLNHADWSRCLLLYKAKYEIAEISSPEAAVGLRALLSHPRCLSIAWSVDADAVMAEADISLSVGFTSTTVEALGARRRAFFFDPGGKFKGSYYDRFPNLVAHDRNDLMRLCKYWLNMPDADFQKYLDDHLAPEFEDRMDSCAVARIREALSHE